MYSILHSLLEILTATIGAWGYDTNDENGTTLYDWVEQKDLALIINLKYVGTFRSVRWQKDYYSNLCFVTKNNHGLQVKTSRQVLSDFLRSQHRPNLSSL